MVLKLAMQIGDCQRGQPRFQLTANLFLQLLRTDMKTLIRLMIAELKNLRSQVSRAAGQAMAELFLNLGTAMEMDLEKTTPILLQRAADTNKFIR